MSYSLAQFEAAQHAARQYLQDRADERPRDLKVEFDLPHRPHAMMIDGIVDLGELITAALDAAHA